MPTPNYTDPNYDWSQPQDDLMQPVGQPAPQPTAQAPYATPPTQSVQRAPLPQISSWQGYTPGGVEDMWGQFLSNVKGYKGQADPYGFGAWGSAGAGTDLNALTNEFNQYTGLNAHAVGNDKIDFGAQGGGVRDVIRNVGPDGSGQWWISQPGGSGGGGSYSGGGGGGYAAPQGSSFGGGGGIDISSLLGGGVNNADDPLGTSINNKLMELIGGNGQLQDPNGQYAALGLENARQMADRARRAEYEGAMSQLAARGLLPENVQGGQGGLALDALGRIERNDISPMFSQAIRDFEINDANNSSQRLMGALNQGTQRQGMLSDVALNLLGQNRAFQQFLAEYGLQRDQVLQQLRSGQNSQLLQTLALYLEGANTSAGGYI